MREQLVHLTTELAEVIQADEQQDYTALAEELLDLIHSAETALRMAESLSPHQIDLDDLRDHVIAKNRSRGYYL